MTVSATGVPIFRRIQIGPGRRSIFKTVRNPRCKYPGAKLRELRAERGVGPSLANKHMKVFA